MSYNRFHWFIGFFLYLIIISPINAAESVEILPPFTAEYQVLRNNEIVGKAILQLRHLQQDQWEFISHTEGTKGLAALFNIDVNEHSQFHWQNGKLESLNYHFEQKTALKDKQRSINFDWVHNTAQSREGNKTWNIPVIAGVLDRHLVVLALSADLKNNAVNFNYPVVDKDKLENKQYAKLRSETLALPIGKLEAVRIERNRGTNNRKRTTSWHAPYYDFLPVQIEQQEQEKNETISLRLLSLQKS